MRLERNPSHDHRTRQSTNGSSPHNASASPHGNGHHTNGDAETNGFRHTNGHSSMAVAVRRNTDPFYGHDREEMTRILLQSLTDLGYNHAAKQLSDESGYALEMPSVVAFRNAVLAGEWEEAESLLFGSEDLGGGILLGNGHDATSSPSWRKNRRLSVDSESRDRLARQGLPLASGADTTALKFMIRQQKYLELLEQRNLNAALSVLRNELTPLKRDTSRLHHLSSLIMAPTVASLLVQAGWDGSTGSSRNQLLSELSKSISPSIMIPEHRLADLLTAVQREQITNCRYHNTDVQPSLYTDHECPADNFPLQVLTELPAHNDEVWCLDFSHDGSLLATAGRDGIVYVFDTLRWKVRHEFTDHERGASTNSSGERGVCCLAFSPDDQYLISCAYNNEFAVYNVRDGRCVARGDHFDYPVTSAAWLPDSQTFVIGTQDSRRPLGLYSLQSTAAMSPLSATTLVRNNEIHSFREPPWDVSSKDTPANSFRVTDVAVTFNGDRLAATTTDNKILMYNLRTRTKIAEFQMEDKLTCINFDCKGEELLVNMHKGKVLLLSAHAEPLGEGSEPGVEVKRRFEGVYQNNFVLRSCFGGAGESVVVSGSEDSRIYIWRRHSGVQVAALEAHPGTVNAVAWHPQHPGMFVSAGDDRRVRIWASASSMRHPSSSALALTPGTDSAGPGASRTSLGLYR